MQHSSSVLVHVPTVLVFHKSCTVLLQNQPNLIHSLHGFNFFFASYHISTSYTHKKVHEFSNKMFKGLYTIL